jgi:cytochrome c oxidase subunit 1
MANDIYLALVTIHGTIMVFFVNCCTEWVHLVIFLYRCKLVHVIWQVWFYEYDIVLVVFHIKRYNDFVCLLRLVLRHQDDLPSIKCSSQAIPGSGMGMTLWLISMALLHHL